MIKPKELAVKVDEFLKRDIEVIDNYCDEFLKDLRLSKKHAGSLLGLCQLCYAQGYVDCEKDKEAEKQK